MESERSSSYFLRIGRGWKGFFGLITEEAIRRGAFHSVAELKTTIEACLD